MRSPLALRRHRMRGRETLLLGALLVCAPALAAADPQDKDLSELLTPSEYAQFLRQKNPTRHVRMLLDAAGRRLQEARRAAAHEGFDLAWHALQTYRALLEHAFARIELVPPGGKRRSAYRDFDVHVRRHLKDLDALVRTFPPEMMPQAEQVLKTVTRLRHEALNAFAGEKILTLPRPKPQ